MPKKKKSSSNRISQNKILLKALRSGKYLFPETIDEVKRVERFFGETDIILPPTLLETDFLSTRSKAVESDNENFAMAARIGSSTLPDNIRLKIIQDIKEAETKRKDTYKK